MNNNHYPNIIASSPSCSIYDLYQNSTVYVNVTDINSTYDSLKFWSHHDLHLAMNIKLIVLVKPWIPSMYHFSAVTVLLQMNSHIANCAYTEPGSCIVTGKNTIIECTVKYS